MLKYPKIENQNETLRKLCFEELNKNSEFSNDLIKERLDYELEIINKTDIAGIILSLYETNQVLNIKHNQIMARGLLGNSMVLYLLGISNINPIKYNLSEILCFGITGYYKELILNFNIDDKIRDKYIDMFKKSNGIYTLIPACHINGKGNKCNIDGEFFIVPEIANYNESDYNEICEYIKETDAHRITDYYKICFLRNESLSLLNCVDEKNEVDINDFDISEIIKYIVDAEEKNNKFYDYIPCISNEYFKGLVKELAPKSFEDLVKINALVHGTNVWNECIENHVNDGKLNVQSIIGSRDDVYDLLLKHCFDKEEAFKITESVRKGKGIEKYKDKLMSKNVPYIYIEIFDNVKYLHPRAYAILDTLILCKLLYVRIHNKEQFDKGFDKYQKYLIENMGFTDIHLTKSRYVKMWQCPKLFYLYCRHPELSSNNGDVQSRMKMGSDVGEFAKGLFGNYVDVTLKKGLSLNIKAMLEKTKVEIENATNVICEAAFDYNGCYCAVDILKKVNNGYEIYEVKSSTFVKDYHLADIAYQKYVLEKCNINVLGTYIITINSEYIKNGDLDITNLFKINDVSNDIETEYNRVPDLICLAKKIYNGIEPDTKLTNNCGNPHDCEFWEYCAKDIPSPSIFELYRMGTEMKYDLYNNGIITYKDVEDNNIELNEKQKRQIDYYLNDKGLYVDKKCIREFLDTLTYPLYFLDFETMQQAIPEYDGTRPYQQIPFQYSLHYIENKDGELKHKEFLARPMQNPLRVIAESLCRDIPMNVCVTAYNKAFECTRLQELADMFPDLSNHLINIKENMKDFLVPFQSGFMYNKEMGGSFSIKSVLPALYPNEPTLDYHNLKGIVHNGGEAMDIFPKMKFMTEEEQKNARESLLRYCELDTYAMVKVWEALLKTQT